MQTTRRMHCGNGGGGASEEWWVKCMSKPCYLSHPASPSSIRQFASSNLSAQGMSAGVVDDICDLRGPGYSHECGVAMMTQGEHGEQTVCGEDCRLFSIFPQRTGE